MMMMMMMISLSRRNQTYHNSERGASTPKGNGRERTGENVKSEGTEQKVKTTKLSTKVTTGSKRDQRNRSKELKTEGRGQKVGATWRGKKCKGRESQFPRYAL